MSDFESLPPGTALIDAIRAEKAPYHSWAGEVIDNSLDAEATRIELTMNADNLKAADNGIGITKKHEQACVMIALHGEMASTKLGRFGVGIKYKSIQHGKIFRIFSRSKDGELRRDVNWDSIRKSERWDYPKARWKPEYTDPTGTIVQIRDLITKAPTNKDIERTITEIQRRYYPAMESNRVILVNDHQIEPFRLPQLKDTVEQTVQITATKSAHIIGGLLVDRLNSKLRQVDICVAYRVIQPETNFGCGDYNGIRSMFARVDLIGDWKLQKFKDSLAEDLHAEDLEIAIENVLRPVLEKCDSQSMSLQHKNIEHLLNEMIPENRRTVRPLQKQRLNRVGEKKGTKSDKEGNGQEAKSGLLKKKKSPPGLKIELDEPLNETCGFGRAQFSPRSARIQLAKDNPTIALLLSQRDLKPALIALYAIAALVYEGDLEARKSSLFPEPMGLRAWKLGEPTILREAAE